MTTTVTDPTATGQAEGLAGRIFQAGLDYLELFSVYLGLQLGLYAALRDAGPLTSTDLATAAGIHERYAREWLEQQAVAGYVEADDPLALAAERRYHLPVGHAEALLDPESLNYVAPFGSFLMCVPPAVPALLEAYRTGGGVHYSLYDPYHREAQGAFNRAAFTKLLVNEWLANGAPGVHARLLADPPARVIDIGCGLGWSSIAIARGYRTVRVDGVDVDAPSIAEARKNAAEAGLHERVRFTIRDITDPSLAGHYDLAVMFEVLHDLSHPVEALRGIQRLLAPGGALIVMDERVAEHFTAPGDEVERFMYAASLLHCLPAGMVEQPSAATGTVLRPDTVRRLASEAGFSRVDVLPVEHDFFRFYRLEP
jgi:2-polyprenyl-3-methyl-5-hydroxy-6-metoxy-1,4-benzoquinol methylase